MLIFYIICTLTVTVNVEKNYLHLKKIILRLLMKTGWLIDICPKIGVGGGRGALFFCRV